MGAKPSKKEKNVPTQFAGQSFGGGEIIGVSAPKRPRVSGYNAVSAQHTSITTSQNDPKPVPGCEGWMQLLDPATKNTYYIDPAGKSHWNLPSSPTEPASGIASPQSGANTSSRTSLYDHELYELVPVDIWVVVLRFSHYHHQLKDLLSEKYASDFVLRRAFKQNEQLWLPETIIFGWRGAPRAADHKPENNSDRRMRMLRDRAANVDSSSEDSWSESWSDDGQSARRVISPTRHRPTPPGPPGPPGQRPTPPGPPVHRPTPPGPPGPPVHRPTPPGPPGHRPTPPPPLPTNRRQDLLEQIRQPPTNRHRPTPRSVLPPPKSYHIGQTVYKVGASVYFGNGIEEGSAGVLKAVTTDLENDKDKVVVSFRSLIGRRRKTEDHTLDPSEISDERPRPPPRLREMMAACSR